MNKKTVYDELLSYKIPKGEAKNIADSFISVQEKGIDILLADLIKFFYKKIELDKFCKTLISAKEKNIPIPLKELLNSELTKEDLLGMADGILYSGIHKLGVGFSDLIHFAKNKTCLTELLKAYSDLKLLDESISLKDLKESNFFLYKPSDLATWVGKICSMDKEVSPQEIIYSRILPVEIEEVLRLHSITKRYKTKISAGELLLLHADNIKIESLIDAVKLAEKNNLKIPFQDIVQYEQSESNAATIINHALIPLNTEIPPLCGVTKDGTEVVVKFTVSTLSDLKYYSKAANFVFFLSKIKQHAVSEISKYKNYNDVNIHLPQISAKIKADFAKTKDAFILIDITINDTDIGRNIEAESEIKRLTAKQIIEEKRAQILEAKLRAEKAKKDLLDLGKHKSHKKGDDKHHGGHH